MVLIKKIRKYKAEPVIRLMIIEKRKNKIQFDEEKYIQQNGLAKIEFGTKKEQKQQE